MNALTGSLYLLGTAAFVLVSLVIGLRLALLSRRTGEKPELYLGFGILGTAVFGYGAQIASVILRGGFESDIPVTGAMVALTGQLAFASEGSESNISARKRMRWQCSQLMIS